MISVALDARYGLLKSRRGIGVYIFNLLKAWRESSPEGIRWVAFGDGRADAQVVQKLRADNIAVRILNQNQFSVWEQWAFPKAAREEGCTILHATANVAPLHSPLPMIMTLHDVIEWHRGIDFPGRVPLRHQVSRAYRMNTIKSNVKHARHILTVSQHAANDICNVLRVPRDKVKVVPLGYAERDGEMDLGVLTENSLLPRSYALAFGALDPRKNTNLLLRIWNEEKPSIALVVVGLEHSRGMPRVPGVHLMGFLPDDRIKALLHNAAVLLFPSFYEGFGLPALEAMGASVPVIVSTGTAAAEVGSGAVLARDPHSVAEWSCTIRQLAHQPAWMSAMVARGHEIASQHSWQTTAQLTLNTYFEVARGRG